MTSLATKWAARNRPLAISGWDRACPPSGILRSALGVAVLNIVQRIVPESGKHRPRRTDTPTLIFHTNGNGESLASRFDNIVGSGTSSYPHYQLAFDGTLEQYCPLERQALSQFSGNAFAISVDCQDSGSKHKPLHEDPLSDAQVHSLAELLVLHSIPLQACTSPKSGGLGFHSQFKGWNKDDRNCPGPARIAQVQAILAAASALSGVPVVQRAVDFDALKELQDACRKAVVAPGDHGECVFVVQGLLGIAQTGVMDDATVASVRAFQAAHGRGPTGIVDAATWKVLAP
jgi:putative peptidoglycan binding protein